MANRLIHESSPYLLQHAHNPVDWYPWGDEALSRAKKEDRPILVSIGYAACHWCHVMEKESFEDPVTAAYMNEHFINIKIDREERPDLDHIYMDAVQAISGSGGWPLNVFLTPDARPFYGGTYFPPQPAFNRASWMDVLQSVNEAFRNRRTEMDAQAENLTAHINSSNQFGIGRSQVDDFSNENAIVIARTMLGQADRKDGGFGKAPKFPQTFTITYLLRFYHQQMLEKGDMRLAQEALDQALLSLDKMIAGGIYDQVGGGFARYSTDAEWLAPHFEKMLYDNALLLMTLSEAYQLTQDARYLEVIDETISFIGREMSHPEGGFFAALDADSEGVEGKFYVWQKEEVDDILGADAEVFCRYFDISDKGNWEHTNILRVKKPAQEFALENNISIDRLNVIIREGKQALLKRREGRVRPLLDDKVILGWNALMSSALCKACAATGNDQYRRMAENNIRFLLTAFRGQGDTYHHTWKEGVAKFPAFLDDLAYLIQALIDLQEITGEQDWLDRAREIAELVNRHYEDESSLFYFFTNASQPDVILRKKELYDGAVPSGNAVMAMNLFKLGLLLDKKAWRERSAKMAGSLGQVILKYPTSFGYWATVFQLHAFPVFEISITGVDAAKLREQVLSQYLPLKVFQSALESDERYPLLRERDVLGKTAIWLCSNYTCQAPVFSVPALISLINKAANG